MNATSMGGQMSLELSSLGKNPLSLSCIRPVSSQWLEPRVATLSQHTTVA